MEKKYKMIEFKFNGEEAEKVKDDDKVITSKSIIQPKFQRGLVWNNPKKKEFIETVLKGYPFGSILLYKSKTDKKYRIVDGLQRMNTLNEYHKNRFDFLSYEYINEEMCNKLISDNYTSTGRKDDIGNEEFQECVVKLRKSIFSDLKKKKPFAKICERLYSSKDFTINKGSDTIIGNIIKDFATKTSVDNLEIPAIIYLGEYEDLPAIFYSLNVGGVKLSKYETYASLWQDDLYEITDDEIIQAVKDKYAQLEKDCDFDVDLLDADFEKGVTLFEYCCALSDIIRSKFSLLFGNKKKTTDPSGFEMLTLVCDSTLGKEEELYNMLKDSNAKFLVDIKDTVVEAFTKIQDVLRPWIIAKNGSINITSSTYMLYHMAMSYILNNYNIDMEKFKVISLKGKSTLTKMEDFENYLPYHYLKDSLDDFWSKHRQVSDLKQLIDNDSDRYYCKISTSEWNDTLNEFAKEQKDYRQNQFSFKTKLFLDYLVKGKINNEKLTKDQQEDEKYFTVVTDVDNKVVRTVDYEHIVTIESIQSKYKDKDIKKIINDDDIPVYSLGNVCYLTSHINRSKKGKNIPDFEAKYPGLEISNKYRKLVNYPEDKELEFAKYNKQRFEEQYQKFIDGRIDKLIKDFKTHVINNIK